MGFLEYEHEERAAIYEYEAGMTRKEAEIRVEWEIVEASHDAHSEPLTAERHKNSAK